MPVLLFFFLHILFPIEAYRLVTAKDSIDSSHLERFYFSEGMVRPSKRCFAFACRRAEHQMHFQSMTSAFASLIDLDKIASFWPLH